MISQTQPLFSKLQHRSVHDIYINISHFIDHFIMLIFAKAAYDAGRFLAWDMTILSATARLDLCCLALLRQ